MRARLDSADTVSDRLTAATRGRRQTKAVGLLALACSLFMTFVALGFTYVFYEIESDVRESGDCESVDHPDPCAEYEVVVFGTGAVGVAAWGAAASVGLLRGRRWGRRSVLIVFSAWAVLTTVWGVGLAGVPEGLATGEIITLAAMVGLFVMVVLLAARLRMPRSTQEAADASALRAKGRGGPTREG